MARTLPKLGPYTVIPDSNALFAKDPRKLVSGGFETALGELRQICTVHLKIPQVVLGELAYQKYKVASASLESATKSGGTIEAITGAKFPQLVTLQNAKRRILQRYRQWCVSVNAQCVSAKVTNLVWNSILEDAIWRTPPFEHSDDGAHEKGFRDRVVLETVRQLCRAAQGEVVLLCKDGLLSASAAKCALNNLTVVPRLEDFASRVRLLKENAEKEWVEELFAAAARQFYSEGNANCIYWRDDIYKKILEMSPDLTPPITTGGLLLEPKAWDRQTAEQITLGTTKFENVDGNSWLWSTEVKSAAAFSGNDILDIRHDGIRVSTFAVKWRSARSETAEIKEPQFQSVTLLDKQMLGDTTDARNQWSLPAKPIAPPSLKPLFGLGAPQR